MSKHKALPPLEINDQIVLQNPRTGLWDNRGKIRDIRENGKSYWVETEGGDQYLRGRALIRNDIVPVTNEQMNEQTNGQTKPPNLDRETHDRGNCDIIPDRKDRTRKQREDESNYLTAHSDSKTREDRVASRTRSRTALKSVSFNKSK